MDNPFEILIYRTAEENVLVDDLVKGETIWLTKKGWRNYSVCKPPQSANT